MLTNSLTLHDRLAFVKHRSMSYLLRLAPLQIASLRMWMLRVLARRLIDFASKTPDQECSPLQLPLPLSA